MLIFADSQNRDGSIYPTGDSYTLHLSRPIRNIERIDLVSARVPNTMYNLTNGSNIFNFNSTSNVSIPPGFYTAGLLAQALSAYITYLPAEGKYQFVAGTFFIYSTEFATMVGMDVNRTYTGPIKSNKIVDFSLNDYIFLDIEELKTPSHIDTGSMNQKGTVSGQNASRAFAPIIMDVNSACIKNFHENKDYIVSVFYPEPINTLDRLTVRWVDRNGTNLNFQGWDANAFILRIHEKQLEIPAPAPPPPVRQALKVPPPPPKIPWFFIVFVLAGLYAFYRVTAKTVP